jgi:hypothetical protein
MRNFFKKRRNDPAMVSVAEEGRAFPSMRERAAPASPAFGAGEGLRARPLTATRPAPVSAEGALPSFTLPVSGGLRGMFGREPAVLDGLGPDTNAALREAFTPTRPKRSLGGLFVGRTATLKRIIAAVEEERAHVILFGDRGRGKTSVANAVEQIAQQAGYFALKVTCSAELGFEDIFRHVLKRIPATHHRSSTASPFGGNDGIATLADRLPPGGFSVTELIDILTGISGTHVLLILDEYDRVTDEDFRNKLAELFKNLTDGAVAVTLLVVGVAENLDQLLGKHPSIQRSLVPVHLPLMTAAEVGRLLTAGAGEAGLEFAPEAVEGIVGYSCGLPYYAQLLGLHAARSAVSRRSKRVEWSDLVYAVDRCLQEAERSLVVSYAQVLSPRQRGELEPALIAAAEAPADEFGVFDPADLNAGSFDGHGALIDRLSRLTREEGGAVLAMVPEPGRTRFRFQNQMMRQYVLMRRAAERAARH